LHKWLLTRLVSGSVTFRTSAGIADVMNEVSRGFPRFHQANAGIVRQIKSRSLTFKIVSVLHSTTILPFGAVWSEVLKGSSDKP
jgi:hypothetical protein